MRGFRRYHGRRSFFLRQSVGRSLLATKRSFVAVRAHQRIAGLMPGRYLVRPYRDRPADNGRDGPLRASFDVATTLVSAKTRSAWSIEIGDESISATDWS